MFVDPPGIARYTCGFRTALEPSAITALAGRLADIEWTVVELQARSLRLSGRGAGYFELEIWSELCGESEDGIYGLSIAAEDRAEGATTYFAWRARIFEAFSGKLIVVSVVGEIRATHDAERDALELDGQDLTELPSDIQILHQHLKILSLSGNRLSKLPDEIALLKNLEELDISDNLLTELPAQIDRLSSLRTLSVEHNRLRALPASIGQLTNLRELRANDNKLRSLPPEVGQMRKLRRLRIQQNRLTELPQEFAQLESLCEWDFTQKGLPPSNSLGLTAGQNLWVYPPEAVVRKGPRAIRDFLTAHLVNVVAEDAEAVYTVYVDDNQHRYEEEWKRRTLGVFADCDAAIAACKEIVDSFFATFPCAPVNGLRGEDAQDLMEVYRRFGEDPWICSVDAGCAFDAWSYADQRCAAIAQATRESPRRAVYTVYVDDNYHHMDESERYKLGDFPDCASAITACKRIVDEFIAPHGSQTAKEMFDAYRQFGEDPFIRSSDTSCVFSAWSYAKLRCDEIAAQIEK